MKMNFTYCKFVYAFLLFIVYDMQAQSTNPAPFCYPSASSMVGGTCTNSLGLNMLSVKLNTLTQTSGCYGSGNTDVYRYWSATTSLNAGMTYPVSIVTPTSGYNYYVSAGVWIDLNRNSRFETSEFLGATLFNNYKFGAGAITHVISLYIPCSATAGKTRMRIRTQGTTKITGVDTCGTSGYGEAWDFDVTIVQPTSVSAGFIAPSQVFVKTVIKFINNNQGGYSEHAWDVNNDGSWEQKGALPDFTTNGGTWTTTGTKCVKLRSTNCYGSDSVTKCLSVVTPSAKPVIGFTKVSPCERVVEVYGSINLIDTSGQGPYNWTWNIYDSVTFKNDPFEPISDEYSGYVVFGNGTTKYSASPMVSFYRAGLYSVELIAKNDVGTSKLTKRAYIKVINPTNYFLGFGVYGPKNDNRVLSDHGLLIDDGGPNNNYSNNQGMGTKSFLIINPPATRPISLKFEQIRLKDVYDTIKIYDNDWMDTASLLAVLTSANNGTYPVFTSAGNKMYFYFSSNSGGVDSGYKAEFTNTGVFKYSKYQNISIGHNILFVNGNSVFYNENQNEFGFNFTKIWSVNDTVQTAYTDMDTLQYKFKYAGTQKVCLEMKDCDTSFKKCKNLLFESGLMGVVYKDNNSNCIYNSGDKLMPNIHMKLFDSTLNNWSHHFTNSLGEYNFNKGTGTYTVAIDPAGMPFRTICPTPGVDSFFRLSGTTPYRVINFDIGCKTGHDVGTRSVWTNRLAFPGRQHDLRVSAGDMNKWFGLNCSANLSGKVVITVSGKVSYVSPSYGALTPDSISGKVFMYNISDFSAVNNNSDFGLTFKTDTNAKVGDTISVKVKVTPVSGDSDTTNNIFTYRYRVVNSYDPNVKEVYPDDLTDGFKDWLTYTIHFQNTGNAPAFDIRIQDTLDNLLDPESIQLLNYSHSASTTLTDKVLSFKFRDIMLPDSNSDEKGSHGFVQFRIKPRTPLAKGTKINNRAFIYFDYNEPVITNTATNNVLPKCVLIPDPAFAAWLTAKYPAAMYRGYLMDTSRAEIKKETSVDVSGKGIANLFGIQFFVSLEDLNCSDNVLSTLPLLPSSVSVLNCADNKLTALPGLPSVLTELNCSGNNLSSLPALPSSLQSLNCSNNKIVCFEKFNIGLSFLNIAGNNNKCVPNYISAMDAATRSTPLCIKGDAVNNPGNCISMVPALVFIPDINFAAWLSAIYPACMYNGHWMDTSCSDIKNATSANVASKGIADLFGIQFFTSLKTLNCSGNLLSTLPVLSSTVTHINCSGNKITGLPALPGTLQVLRCDNNELTSLPALPSTINYIGCSGNKIKNLPVLPGALENLYCDRNQLSGLPALPGALKSLSCINNAMITLPALPASLSVIICDSNQLDFLPTLPANLNVLSCEYNQLTQLPQLPSGLAQLYCNNNKIVCFEEFAENITAINISANNNKCLPNYISAMDAASKLTPLCIAGDKQNNPDNCPGKPLVNVRQPLHGEVKATVYPNPGTGVYHIDLPEAMETDIEVYNTVGQLVYKVHHNERQFLLDIGGQPGGVYVLKIYGTDGIQSVCILKS